METENAKAEERKYDESKELTLDDTWSIVQSITNDFGFARSQIESFNYFIEHILPNIFISSPPIVVSCKNINSSHKYETHTITYKNIYLSKPFINEDDASKKVTTPVRKKDEHDLNVLFCYPEHSRLRNLVSSHLSNIYN
jgi:DNA-directed RNA polymerase beta subunit